MVSRSRQRSATSDSDNGSAHTHAKRHKPRWLNQTAERAVRATRSLWHAPSTLHSRDRSVSTTPGSVETEYSSDNNNGHTYAPRQVSWRLFRAITVLPDMTEHEVDIGPGDDDGSNLSSEPDQGIGNWSAGTDKNIGHRERQMSQDLKLLTTLDNHSTEFNTSLLSSHRAYQTKLDNHGHHKNTVFDVIYAHMWLFNLTNGPTEAKGPVVVRVVNRSLLWGVLPFSSLSQSTKTPIANWRENAHRACFDVIDECSLVAFIDIGKLATDTDTHVTPLHFQLVSSAGVFILQAHNLTDKRAFAGMLRFVNNEMALPMGDTNASIISHKEDKQTPSSVWRDLIHFQERMVQAEDHLLEIQHDIELKLEAVSECLDSINQLSLDEHELLHTIQAQHIAGDVDFRMRLARYDQDVDKAITQVNDFSERVATAAQRAEQCKREGSELLEDDTNKSAIGKSKRRSTLTKLSSGAVIVTAVIAAINPWGIVALMINAFYR